MNRIIESVRKRIDESRDVFQSLGVPIPETVDIYMGQPNNPEEFEFVLPAVFIDYSTDYDNETAFVHLHVLYEYGYDTENFAPNCTEGMEYVMFLKALKRCLNGLKTSNLFGILRLQQDTPIQTDGFHYHQLSFRCNTYFDLDKELYPFVDIAYNVEVEK